MQFSSGKGVLTVDSDVFSLLPLSFICEPVVLFSPSWFPISLFHLLSLFCCFIVLRALCLLLTTTRIFIFAHKTCAIVDQNTNPCILNLIPLFLSSLSPTLGLNSFSLGQVFTHLFPLSPSPVIAWRCFPFFQCRNRWIDGWKLEHKSPNHDFMDARVASDFVQKDIIYRETPASVHNHLALVESSELWSDTTKHKQLMVEFFQQMRFFGVSIAPSLCNYKSVTVPKTVRTFTGPLKKKKGSTACLTATDYSDGEFGKFSTQPHIRIYIGARPPILWFISLLSCTGWLLQPLVLPVL